MRQAAKWLGLVALTTAMVPFAENPGFSKETRLLMPVGIAQSENVKADFTEVRRLMRRVDANHLLMHGTWQFERSQFHEALQTWEQALQIYRDIGDLEGEGQALGMLGIAYFSLGDYHRAIDFHEQSLRIARELSNQQEEERTLGNLGIAYYGLGDYRRAINFHEQALVISQALANWSGQGRTLMNLGNVHNSLGDYRRAIDFYEQSLAISQALGDLAGEGRTIGNLGTAYQSLGDYRRAIHFYEQRLFIARLTLNRGGEGNALGNLGNTYIELGDYRRAIEFHEQGLLIAREIGNRNGEGSILGNLGNAYNSLGDYRQAIAFHEQHLAIAREIGDQNGESIALHNLGNSHSNLGDYQSAVALYEQSLAIDREIGSRDGEGSALGGLGFAHLRLRNYSRAIDFYEQSLVIAHELGILRSAGITLNNLGIVYLNTEQFALAEVVLDQAVDVWDALRDSDLPDADKISLFETQRGSSRLLQRVLIAQGKVGPALAVAERGRGRAFAELLSQRLSTDEAALNRAPPNLDTIQALAQQQQTTLVQYSLIRATDDDYTALYIWVVSPTSDITFRRQPLDDADLTSLVTTARDAIGVRGEGPLGPVFDHRATITAELTPEGLAQLQARTEGNLRQLYDLLITPIADLLPADPEQPVVFMPQDELFLVPFAALKAPDGQYLIENHTILTSPSIQVFGLANDIARRRLSGVEGNALIVGNPTMPTVTFLSEGGSFQDVQLTPLPGAQREAEAISGFLQTPALLGSEATRAAVKQRMAGADVIHLATHGLLEYGDPRQTGTRDFPGAIALAPGGGENGLLTAAEILQMDLRADLAVLSACDTGRGRVTGDGVVGLSRAFVAAGVPSIIVSLWAVDDQATADLMVAFYDHWQQSGDKAQALRQAMLTTMQQHPDPRLWSAFTLIGSPQ